MLTAFPQGTSSLHVKLSFGQGVGSRYKKLWISSSFAQAQTFYTQLQLQHRLAVLARVHFIAPMVLVSRVSAQLEVDVGKNRFGSEGEVRP